MAVDVVCGMTIDEKGAAAQAEYKGQTFYFCSADCKRSFEQDPEQYAGKAA